MSLSDLTADESDFPPHSSHSGTILENHARIEAFRFDFCKKLPLDNLIVPVVPQVTHEQRTIWEPVNSKPAIRGFSQHVFSSGAIDNLITIVRQAAGDFSEFLNGKVVLRGSVEGLPIFRGADRYVVKSVGDIGQGSIYVKNYIHRGGLSVERGLQFLDLDLEVCQDLLKCCCFDPGFAIRC
jgi:hypothetical protein